MRANHHQRNESVPSGPLPGTGRGRALSGRMAVGLAVVGIALFPTLVGGVAGTPAASAAQATVDLGTATPFSVLAGAGVTNTGDTVLGGDLGTCPTPAIVGFPPGDVQGTQHANDAVACQAQSDLTIAYDSAAGRASTKSYTGAADLGGSTLTTGVYTSSVSFGITGPLTLDAESNPDAVFIFQAASTLITEDNSSVRLINGAQACNVFWQVGSSATLGVGSTFAGTVMALTSITANTNATVDGRLLARNGAVTLDTNRVTAAACTTGVPSSSTPSSATPTTSPSSTTTLLSGTTATQPVSTTTTTTDRATSTSSTRPGSSVLPPTTTSGPVPPATFPRTGSPVGIPVLLAVTALVLGAVAMRLGRAQAKP